jgi:glycosyltransferase involved in cell wall biosynthesis
VLLVSGSLDTRTGGYIYDRRMMEGLRQRGWTVDVAELDAGFPHPAPAALDQAARALGAVPDGTLVLVDSLALGAMPDLLGREASRLRFVGLVHLPLAAAYGLDPAAAARLESSERRALQAMSLVIVTGTATRPLLARYDLPPDRIVVVEPGTDPAPMASSQSSVSPQSYVVSGFSRTDRRPVELLTVATLHPGKGHEILLDALAAVPHHDWRLVCAGSLTRDPATADRVRTTARRLRLDDRVRLAGDLDGPALAACYDRADLFVLATLQETYGMAVAEALARGLPVVATSTGAIPELVGDEAGVLVPAGDVPALAGALARVMGDADCRARLAEGARRVRDRLPTWETASGRMAAALERVASHG